MIKGLILLLHRELTEVTDMTRAGLSKDLSAFSDRMLLLRHGACLLHLLWCHDSSFTEHRGAVDQYYVHLVCSLIRLFQQLSGISQVEGMYSMALSHKSCSYNALYCYHIHVCSIFPSQATRSSLSLFLLVLSV